MTMIARIGFVFDGERDGVGNFYDIGIPSLQVIFECSGFLRMTAVVFVAVMVEMPVESVVGHFVSIVLAVR